MDEKYSPNGMFREDVVIFVAEDILCERNDVPIDGAAAALADMAVTSGVGLVEMARCIVVGEIDPGPSTEASLPAGERMANPEIG